RRVASARRDHGLRAARQADGRGDDDRPRDRSEKPGRGARGEARAQCNRRDAGARRLPLRADGDGRVVEDPGREGGTARLHRETQAGVQGTLRERTMPKGLLLMMTDIDAAHEADFNRWYEEEHLAERMAIPGFINARRFTALEGGPKYLALYDLESPDVLQSAAYRHVVGE